MKAHITVSTIGLVLATVAAVVAIGTAFDSNRTIRELHERIADLEKTSRAVTEADRALASQIRLITFPHGTTQVGWFQDDPERAVFTSDLNTITWYQVKDRAVVPNERRQLFDPRGPGNPGFGYLEMLAMAGNELIERRQDDLYERLQREGASSAIE